MSYFIKKISFAMILSMFFFGFSGNLYSQNAEKKPVEEIRPSDIVILSTTTSLALVLEIFNEPLAPTSSAFGPPGALDRTIRSDLKWPNSSLTDASHLSDFFLYSLVSSAVWLPLFDKEHYWKGFHMMAESISYTLAFTGVVKLLSGRRRPYSYFNTAPSDPGEDYLSFFSGHTAVSFAAATTASLYISNLFPKARWWAIPLAYIMAASAGYMRIAADKHYFTDVLTGAAVGSAIGWGVYSLRRPWFQISLHTGGVKMQAGYKF